MPFIIESPHLGPMRSFCWVKIVADDQGITASIAMFRDEAAEFPSKSVARRVMLTLPDVILKSCEFEVVEK